MADKMNWIKDNFKILLATFVILLTFTMFYSILMIEIEQQNEKIIIYLLGVLSAIITQIVSHYFGSSDSSSKKTEMIHEMMSGGNNDAKS